MHRFPYFERRAMHMQPQAVISPKGSNFLRLPIDASNTQDPLEIDIFFPMQTFPVKDPLSAIASRVVVVECGAQYVECAGAFLLWPLQHSSSSRSIVDLHGRRRSGSALAVVCGEAHACLCFFDRVRFFLQSLHSAHCQCLPVSSSTLQRTSACAPCPSGGPAYWPHSQKTLRILCSSSAPDQAGLLWALHP